MRVLLVVVGLAIAGYGGWILWESTNTDGLLNIGVWLVGGVLIHDLIIAGAVAVVGWSISRYVPGAVRPWLQGGLIVAGCVTIMAIPVLVGAGRKPDNPSLLPLDYTRNWLLVMGLIAATSILLALIARGRQRAANSGQAES